MRFSNHIKFIHLYKQMNEILERESIVQSIKNILTNYEANCADLQFKKGIYIYGSPGCGKTRFVNDVLKSLNYDIVQYDAGDVRNKSLIDTITSNNMASQNVLQMMARKPKKIAIIMDEIDGMNNGDKGGITALIKLIRQKKTKKQKMEHMTRNPVICIGNYYVDKKIKELMKVCHTFELKPPTPEQMSKILGSRILTYPSLCPDLQAKIIHYIQGDLRKIEWIEKMVKVKPGLLTSETLDHIFHRKCFNEDSKKITKRLLETPLPLSHHASVINETDRTIVALLWHENIVDVLSKQPNQKAIPFYLKILENICFADFIDRITFQHQIWQFNEMSSLIKTFYNHSLYHKAFPEHTAFSGDIRFTKVLTKYSTEYNNQLFIYHLCQELDMDKKDIVALFQELRLFYGENWNEHMTEIERIFENTNIDKLDIKRMYRYLDKNVKREQISEEESDYYF
jgi:DNA polymerase III delta prime subunit